MNKHIFLLLLVNYLLMFSPLCIADDGFENAVLKFKQAIQTDNPKIIAEYVKYPFKRSYPLPTIHNQKEFIDNYSTIIDQTVKSGIINSQIKDWHPVGWRGIMLYQGRVWINPDGKLIAINFNTKEEDSYIEHWQQEDRNSLHTSLKEFDQNIYTFKTSNYIGRIDEIKKTPISYRLALWNIDKKMSDKPDIVINNGTVEYQGSANNHFYTFIDKETHYVFNVTYVGSMHSVPYVLDIYQNDNDIYAEEAILIE